MLNCKTDT